MKKLTNLFIIIVIFFMFTPSLHSYFRGVHYWGNSWTVMFWNSLELKNVDNDFKKIKKDGFNTIILAIPWGEFQPTLNPITYNYFALNRLKFLLKKAQQHNLYVILRVSYSWDFYPKVTPSVQERFIKIFFDNSILNSWSLYLKKIYSIAKSYPNFLSGFITWEDFFLFYQFTVMNKSLRKKYANEIGFVDFLKKRYSLKDISKIYDIKFHLWSQIYIPSKKEPAFKLFLQYWDFLLTKRILLTAKKVFPKLSMEIRIDKDPIYSKKGKIIQWYDHTEQYKSNLDFFTIYYTPAWGAKNIWNYELSDTAIKRFKYMLKDVKSKISGKYLFIDQFNFYDDSPPSIGNTIIHPGFIPDFLDKACNLLKRYTRGYALWTYKDYEGSMIFNGFFEMGKLGWNTKGKAKIVNYNNDKMLKLYTGSSVNQYISKERENIGWFSFYKNINLCFKAFSKGKSSILEIGNSQGFKKKILLNQHLKNFCFKFPYSSNYNIYFKSLIGSSVIDNVKLFGCIQRQLLYDSNYNPECLLESIRKLNNCLK